MGVSPPPRTGRRPEEATSAGRAQSRLLGSPGSAGPRQAVVRRPWLRLGGVASAGSCWSAVLLDGARGAVLGLALLVLGWTVTGLLHHQHRARLVRRRRVAVAQACAALAAQLRIGQVPAWPWPRRPKDHPVLREARDAQDLGGDVVRVWRSQARQAGAAGLLELARAWQVSGRTGAPMSATLEQVAAALAAEQDLRAVVAGELSAPRATGKVMAVLPVCGVGLGYLLGGEPIGWLVGRAAGLGLPAGRRGPGLPGRAVDRGAGPTGGGLSG